MRAQSRFFGLLPFAFLIAAPDIGWAGTPLATVRVAAGLALPLYVTAPPGDTARLFIVEQRGADGRGRIKILKNGVVLPRPFLTTNVLSTGFEQGLLGLVFAPDYATTGRFYIDYTRADSTTIVARHTVSSDPDSADPTGTEILSIAQPFPNHNGGWLGFGPDGYLYISSGDGGSGGDPGDRAQNLDTLLGKILRIDVSGSGYTVPPDNPFQGATPGLDAIWAFGLRNPWRCSFDRLTGDFTIGDVGQDSWEEIDFAPAGTGSGANYGWRCFEGSAPFTGSATNPCASCTDPGCVMVFPAHEYPHTLSRCSVTGGYVYRGCAIPDLQGTYFFGDYCAATIYSGSFVGDTLTSVVNRTAELAPGGGLAIGSITSFGEDARGELYICDGGGEVFKIVPAASVLEEDMPSLHTLTAAGDSLGSTTPGNALAPGVIPFAAAGSRIRGVGYLSDAVLQGCATIAGGCLTSRTRLGPFDIDLEACVDFAASRLTRRFVFTNHTGGSEALAHVDVVAPAFGNGTDAATTQTPAGGDSSAVLLQTDGSQPDLFVRQWARGSTGVTYSSDVDTAAELSVRVAADLPLAGGASAGPATVGLALGFDFGLVGPAAAETVTVVTELTTATPTGVSEGPAAVASPRFLAAGPVPFSSELRLALALPTAGWVAIDVFDVSGRRVRTLYRGTMTAGTHLLRWDGRTTTGAEAPTGIYFIRAATEHRLEARRVLRIR